MRTAEEWSEFNAKGGIALAREVTNHPVDYAVEIDGFRLPFHTAFEGFRHEPFYSVDGSVVDDMEIVWVGIVVDPTGGNGGLPRD